MTTSVTAAVGVALFLLAQGAIEVANDLIYDEPVSMRLVSLEYDNGNVRQMIEVTGRDAIRGEWAAKVIRGDEFLCSGGGKSAYVNKPVKMPVNKWVGSDCPSLKPGDVLHGAWQWTDGDGITRGISGELVLP